MLMPYPPKAITQTMARLNVKESMEMEEYITAKLAEYVDEHLGYFAEIVE